MPGLQTSKGYPKKAIASDVIAQKGPHYRPCARLCQCQIANTCRKLELNQYLNLTRNSFYLLNYFGLGFCKDAATRQPNICRLDYSSPRANQLLMPRERIELPCLRLQCNALTAKPPRLLYQAPEGTLWRKIESNYHICSASTTDYHYQISPVIIIDFTTLIYSFKYYFIELNFIYLN